MSFDYIELLTIRQALVFTQKAGEGINLECVIRKVEAEMKKKNGGSESEQK